MSSVNLASLTKSSGPFSGSVKATVVKRLTVHQYRRGEESRQSLTVGVADESGVAKVIIYDPAQFPRFQEGNTVTIRNLIRRSDKTVVVTRNTRSFLTAKTAVPEERSQEARLLVDPPAAEIVSLSVALKSPPRTKVSVRGQIVQEDQEREVVVNKQPTRIKDIYIKDSSTPKANVTLWRDTCDIEHRPGDCVTVIDAMTSVYKGETSLSLTPGSTIQASEHPVEEQEVIIEGIGGNGEEYELLTNTGDVIPVVRMMLDNIIPAEANAEQYMIDNSPLTMRLTMRGSTVENLEIV